MVNTGLLILYSDKQLQGSLKMCCSAHIPMPFFVWNQNIAIYGNPYMCGFAGTSVSGQNHHKQLLYPEKLFLQNSLESDYSYQINSSLSERICFYISMNYWVSRLL